MVVGYVGGDGGYGAGVGNSGDGGYGSEVGNCDDGGNIGSGGCCGAGCAGSDGGYVVETDDCGDGEMLAVVVAAVVVVLLVEMLVLRVVVLILIMVFVCYDFCLCVIAYGDVDHLVPPSIPEVTEVMEQQNHSLSPRPILNIVVFCTLNIVP